MSSLTIARISPTPSSIAAISIPSSENSNRCAIVLGLTYSLVYSGAIALNPSAPPNVAFSPTPPIWSALGVAASADEILAVTALVPVPNAASLPPIGRDFRTLHPLDVYGLLASIARGFTSWFNTDQTFCPYSRLYKSPRPAAPVNALELVS